MNVALAVAPLILLAVGFIVFCLYDIWSKPSSRHLPRWAWTAICLVSIPLGGLAYLLWGRDTPGGNGV